MPQDNKAMIGIYGAIILTMIIWGSTFVFSKILPNNYHIPTSQQKQPMKSSALILSVFIKNFFKHKTQLRNLKFKF